MLVPCGAMGLEPVDDVVSSRELKVRFLSCSPILVGSNK